MFNLPYSESEQRAPETSDESLHRVSLSWLHPLTVFPLTHPGCTGLFDTDGLHDPERHRTQLPLLAGVNPKRSTGTVLWDPYMPAVDHSGCIISMHTTASQQFGSVSSTLPVQPSLVFHWWTAVLLLCCCRRGQERIRGQLTSFDGEYWREGQFPCF